MTQLKSAFQSCQLNLEREEALFRVISNIRNSLDLDEILKTTIQEMRQILDLDRVGIVRLNSHKGWDEGEFIAETVTPRFNSALAARVQDHCFGEQYADAYKNGRIHVINDIYAAGLSPCHIEILSQFQVRANLLVPLLQGENLWGLLCIHQCSGPRQWQSDEIEFASKIAVHLGVAIQHAELLTQTQQQAAELKQTLQQLQSTHIQLAQAEKMAGLGQLAGGVAHEINNPVNFIQGNLNHAKNYIKDLFALITIYQEHYPTDITAIQEAVAEIDVDVDFLREDLPKLLHSMSVGATRISDIVTALRNFSRLDEMGLKSIDLHQSIEDTLLLIKHRLKATEHRPEIQVQKNYGQLSTVECYPGQINQVLMSLLSNAVDAFDEEWARADLAPTVAPPTLSVGTQAFSDTVLITIEDNGPGMSDTVKAKIYDPFFTTKPVGSGTGLGLAIDYQIIVKHQGMLQCFSELGQGTEFSIKLPVKQSQPTQSAPNSEILSAPYI